MQFEVRIQNLTFLLQVSKAQFKPDESDRGRSGVRDALIAMIHFISNHLSDGTELVQPLNELLYGLEDLDNGRVVPLLQPAKVGHRPPNPHSMKLFRADAAVLMDLYIQSGVARQIASRRVARELNRLGYKDGGQRSINAAQVEDWRDTVRAEAGSDDLSGRRYAFALERLSAMFPGKPQDAAKFMLDAIPSMIPPQIPRNPAS